ncbi:MAG TPA: hypothetical protein VL485_21290 [Ktedonobacteraceae bacterium]|nr:hypothetical protein [Ktedonobacteraceae bacterium]
MTGGTRIGIEMTGGDADWHEAQSLPLWFFERDRARADVDRCETRVTATILLEECA